MTKSFLKQWILANLWWSILATLLLFIGLAMIGSWTAAIALCIHIFLFKYRAPIILRKNCLEYKFSDNFISAGSFFIIIIGLLGYSINSGFFIGILSGLIYGWVTGKRVIKKSKRQLT
ncbi:MAG: hypothetical protein AAF383_31130 [Cyanobacteria bacterium P01_A01_bin.83]